MRSSCFALLCALGWLAPCRPARAQSAATPVMATRRPTDGPTVRELIGMVKMAARHLDPQRIRALVRRARLSGLAPTLRLSAERGLKQDLSSSTTSDAERLAAAIGDNIKFEAALTFDLQRLVFAPEEVRLLSVERWLSTDQRKLIDEAIKLHFQRRRLLAEKQQAAQADLELEVGIAELEALLDAMTQGAYSKSLSGR